MITGKRHAVLWQVLAGAYARLGFEVLGDGAFVSWSWRGWWSRPRRSTRAGAGRAGGGPPAAHDVPTLARAARQGYRDKVAAACYAHAAVAGDLSLVPVRRDDLYFEAENEDELRKVGYSKERRVDPQVVVGLLVDRGGFPLEVGCFEGNKAETLTLLPVIQAFQDRHAIERTWSSSPTPGCSRRATSELDEAGLRFIVGSRVTKAPIDLASHFRWHGDAFTDGQVIDTITPRRGGRPRRERHPSCGPSRCGTPRSTPGRGGRCGPTRAKRAARDAKTLTAQENRAKAVIAGEKAARTPRFVTVKNGTTTLDEASLARARRLVGLKGYVTNIPAPVMPAGEVIASYHDLWQGGGSRSGCPRPTCAPGPCSTTRATRSRPT